MRQPHLHGLSGGGEEKRPGTHCLHMLRYPKNLRISDTIVYLSVHKSL